LRIWLTGDSTTSNQSKDEALVSWGEVLINYFNPFRASVRDRALSGHSIRDFVNRGRWDELMEDTRRGDILLACHGHLERAPLIRDSERSRGSLQGDSDDFEIVFDPFFQREEIVYSFGWYVRKYVADCRARGIELVLMTATPRNRWEEGRMIRGVSQHYADCCRKIADETGTKFLDAGDAIIQAFTPMGEETVSNFYQPGQQVHTNERGAHVMAGIICKALAEKYPETFESLVAKSPVARRAAAAAAAIRQRPDLRRCDTEG
jgi:rhamnogalacturonan acetylesterase